MAAVAEGTVPEMDMEEDSYVLEQVTIPDYSDEDFTYEEVPVEDNYSVSEGSEDLETAVRTLKEETVDKNILQKQSVPVLRNASVSLRPEVIDDFVRNFLVKMGMTRTLDCFQNEWYELQERGLLDKEEVKVVPDIYVSNQNLDDMVKSLREEVTRFKDTADRARQTYVRLRKERDFHRMHHKRVVQEKNKLITDLRRLKKHYASYEPTLKTLKQKYEVAMKEKMLTKLERDRAVGQIIGLQSTLQNMGENINFEEPQGNTGTEIPKESGEKVMERDLVNTTKAKRHPKDTSFPPDMGINPLLAHQKGPSPHLSRAGGFRLTNTINAHNLAVSGISLHPRKQVLTSCSDDNTWKMWSVPSGDLIMTGEGHKDWIADCDFHPSGGRLATVSGDSTVKIWDFTKAECVLTFTDHIHAVWGCSWHSCGDFLATCSMDCSGKIWDLNSERCRLTLRGHADSVNSISFLPYSNTLLSCSADKTLSLWDARTGLCGQTFFGHLHSINHCVFNLRGDMIASCDSYGEVKLWDVRTVGSLASIDLGPHPANRVAFDPSGSVLAIASNDGSVRMHEVASSKQSQLTGHEEAVQTVLFDKSGEFLMSAGSDGTVRIWS